MSLQGPHLTPTMSPNCLLPGAGRDNLHTGIGEKEAPRAEVLTPLVRQSLLGDTSVTKNLRETHPHTMRGLVLKQATPFSGASLT